MKKEIAIAFAIVAVLAFILHTPEDIKQLQSVEVREYEGERLGSVANFRENSIKGVQNVDIYNYTLEVTGLVKNNKSYTYADVLARQKYSKVVTLYCVEGWSVKALWEGTLVSELIGEVKPEANTVIFHAVDGYTTSLPLDYVIDNDIIVAYKINGIALPPANGFPFQLVAEDKLGYKWIRWLNKIELSDNPDYMGFWESRGYGNTADVE